jgi:hypothetical protein
MIKSNPWTLALIGAGLVSLPAVCRAEETNQINSVLTALSATTLSGYVDTSAQWNLGTGNQNVPNYAFGGPSKADGFNLNVVKLTLEHPVDAAAAWSAGYKVDLLFGPDANAFNTSSSLADVNDFAIKQAYVALHAPLGNGLDVKMGVWDTIIGYEVFESINNPNVTRSYGYSIEPTTHTGINATYQFCDAVSATAGIANTFGPQINQKPFLVPNGKAESYKAYMAAVTLTAPTNMAFLSGSTLTACVINGFNGASPAANSFSPTTGANQTSFYVGASLNTPVTGLKVGACYDYASVANQWDVGTGTYRSGYANAVGGYISFQVTEKLSVYGRGEYASSDNAATFMARSVVETTATVQYDLWKNVLSRLEFRWDHAADGSDPYGGTGSAPPFQGGKGNSYILLADVSYKF